MISDAIKSGTNAQPGWSNLSRKTDTLLKNYSTPMAAALAVVVCVTGVMMFFRFYKSQVEALHEWLGVAFVVAVLLHLLRHRRPVSHLLTQKRTGLLFCLTALAAAAFIFLAPAKEGNPIKLTITAVLQAPVKDIAPVLGISPEEALNRLAAAGALNAATDQSIASIARTSQASSIKLLAALTSKSRKP